MICSVCGTSNRNTAGFCNGCGTSTRSLAQTGSLAGASPTLTSQARPGDVLAGRYQIVRVLGLGGFGAVYLAKDSQLGGRATAIKELIANGAADIQGFKQEVLMLAALRHDLLPHVYGHFEENGRWYLAMEYIEGQTLEEYADQCGGSLPMLEVLEIGVKLCEVLDYLHSQKPPVIFRDLKPLNIMITPAKRLYLIDFGIARHFKSGKAKDTIAMGSSGYAAPEQYGKKQTTAQSDLYSLGATLHFLLTGVDPSATPFRFDMSNVSNGHVRRLFDALLEMDADARPSGAHDVRERLLEIQSLLQPTNVVPVAVQPSPSPTAPPSPYGVKTIPHLFDQDEARHVKALEKRFAVLFRQGRVRFLHNRQECPPGKDRAQYWQEIINAASTILIWRSSGLYFDDAMMNRIQGDVPPARQRGVIVIPILAAPLGDENESQPEDPLLRLFRLPKNGGVLSDFSGGQYDRIIAEMASEIKKALGLTGQTVQP